MIFNTTAQDLNLNSGAISKSILRAAGPVIQLEVAQYSLQRLYAGQHVTTSGGNLSCQLIFHAALQSWDQGKGQAQQVNVNTAEHINMSFYHCKRSRKKSVNSVHSPMYTCQRSGFTVSINGADKPALSEGKDHKIHYIFSIAFVS